MTFVLEVSALIGIAASFVMLALAWPELPQRVAVHFGITGRPDVWGPKAAVLLWPVLVVLIYGVLETAAYAAGHAKPKPGNDLSVERLALLFAAIKIEVIAFFLFIQFQALEVSLGRSERIHPAALAIFPIVLVTTTVLLLRLR